MDDDPPPELDRATADAARTVIEAHGLAGLTVERLAQASGRSRMTLHRRKVTRRVVVDALLEQAADAYVTALWPAMTSTANGAARLSLALEAMCTVADDHLALLAGLFADAESPFHTAAEPPADTEETNDIFVAPLARILRDGAADGTLASVDDPTETAAVVFNLVGWGYVHLRYAQRWPAARARPAVVAFAAAALGPTGPR